MPQHDVVVIGGSAGSLEPLTTIVKGLPVGLKASVLVVMHTRAGSDGVLPQILRRATVPVDFAAHAERFKHGHVYVAQPDRHLIVAGGGFRVVHGPRENGFRPAIDPLFRTAARELGPRVVGVILSGALSDGAYGLSLIKQHGGVAIVQDPEEAKLDSMPKNALSAVDADYVLPAAQIAAVVTRLIDERPTRGRSNGELRMPRANDGELEPQLPSENTKVSEMEDRYGAPSPLTCPDCGGSLWEVQEGNIVRYQCHTGHQFAPDSLDGAQRDAVDSALWSAVRVLEEHSELKKRMAKRAADNGMSAVSAGFAEGARDAHSQAQRIRSLLFTADTDPVAGESAQKRTQGRTRRRASGGKRRTRKIRHTRRRD
jgi:two-component system chemotaxis response regulator CheB